MNPGYMVAAGGGGVWTKKISVDFALFLKELFLRFRVNSADQILATE